MFGVKLPDLRGVQRSEIWGIVIIACFNLAFLAVALRFGNLGPTAVLSLVIFGQLFVAIVISQLLFVRAARDKVDDLRKATESMNELNARLQSILSDSRKDNSEKIEILMKILESYPCLKNLPPS